MTTLSDLKTRARQTADMVNSQFITDAELLNYINSAYFELYDKLVGLYEDYFITSTTFTLAASATYTLAADFYKLRGLEYQNSSSDYVTLDRFNWEDRNRGRQAYRMFGDTPALRYRVVGSTIHVEPADQCAGTYQVWYIPSLTALAVDADVVNTQMTRNGWDEYIVVDAAIRMLEKEGNDDARPLQLRKQMLDERIVAAASNRDANRPEVIADVRRPLWDRGDWWQ